VDGAEARCGESEEDGGMSGDRLVDALAAFEAGPDEVAGIERWQAVADHSTSPALCRL